MSEEITKEEIEVIKYFQKNLIKGLKIPKRFNERMKQTLKTKTKITMKEELLKMVSDLSLETYNMKEEYFCIKGINGHVTIIHYSGDSQLYRIRQHLLQMGRDTLKMELNSLLSITQHN
jgi:hypothetical protein|tara:strand:+ start:948 stop:1304 length:357 start_codon:yes stop_codon:yes gene_type:complete